jgi:tRNA-splicing ligase RtcB
MLHSGSRNIGKRVCDYFNSVAKFKNDMWYSNNYDIPFLPIDSLEGKSYLNWMTFAMGFALLNRKAMMEEMKRNLSHYFPSCIYDEMINIHHNYASLEHHMGKDVWVHRKGATLARKDTVGIIPGSMGTSSYIVRGLGNKMSLESCSHGAGRTMGRKAFNMLNNTPEKLAEIEKQMEGIVYTKFGRATRGKDAGMKDVSEAPDAYKSIDTIMQNQLDLVEPIVKLTPLINWKSEDPE